MPKSALLPQRELHRVVDAPRGAQGKPPDRVQTRSRAALQTAPQPQDAPYEQTTDVEQVKRPVGEHVHKNLALGWKINQRFPMCYIFDAVLPSRQFDSTKLFNKDEEPAEYGSDPNDIADIDCAAGDGLMPYEAWNFEYVTSAILRCLQAIQCNNFRSPHFVKCEITERNFLWWRPDELRPIEVGVLENIDGKPVPVYGTVHIPAPYDRILAQLLAEIEHGTKCTGLESRRRQTFAREVLYEFWVEIQRRQDENGNQSFRSRVLTPILQRQLRGVEENYRPVVEEAVACGGDEPTIEQATKFYLKHDPIDRRWIRRYRRNLLYVPEVRWHLAVVMGKVQIGDEEAYDAIRDRTDKLHQLRRMDYNESDDDGQQSSDEDEDEGKKELRSLGKTPKQYSREEVGVIVDEGLEEFFEIRAWARVCFFFMYHRPGLTN